jgi:hypothetical protein
MTARTNRRTRTLVAVSVTAGAVALAMLPTTEANAAASVPVFSYIDVAVGDPNNPVRQLAVDDVFGTSGASTQAAANLTPANVQTYTYDVSNDGTTMVVAARTGTPTTDAFDSTYGLVVVHDNGTTKTSKLLSQFWAGNPVLSDASTVWWLEAGTLYSADAITGLVVGHGKTFAPRNNGAAKPVDLETIARLAVNGSGTVAAVMYRGLNGQPDRVLAATIATGKTGGNYAEVSYPVATLKPDSSTFVWRDATQLLLNESDPGAASPVPLKGASVTLPTGGTPVAATTAQPALDDFYDIRLAQDGTWWMWKDTAGLSTAYSQTDVDLLTTPVVTPPTPQSTDRGNGNSTFRYVPSTVAPPALDSVLADNRATVSAVLATAPTAVLYNGKVAYQSYGLYGGNPGGTLNAAHPAEVDRGQLWISNDGGATKGKSVVTTGASAFLIGSKYYNAYSGQLRRNTWYRWTSVDMLGGDLFTKGFANPRWVKVTVVPAVSVTSKASGAYRIVSGAVTRPTGTAYLYRYISGKYVYLTSTRIVRTGTYTGKYVFAKRKLPRGTYKVATVSDTYMGSGAKTFKI